VQWSLADARAMRLTSLSDFLWVRIFDVERMLGERSYERDGEIVFEVVDEIAGKRGPAAGSYRLTASGGSATCTRTDSKAELTVEARHLGAASLGGTRLTDAARAFGMEEHRPGAAADLELLLRTADVPWCSTFF
jgi:predicted acetyltransferase